MQAQELRSARLALRARGAGFDAGGVDAALSRERSLVVAWLMRGTLHLVAAEDHGWLLALTAPTVIATNRRRLGQLGISPDDADRAVEIVAAALADGPLTRPQLAERIAAAGIRTEGQATPHLLLRAALRGISVLGPVVGGEHAFVLARDWIGEPAAMERDTALTELARRWLAAHGPASERDLATWSGLSLRDVRAGLRGVPVVEAGGGLVDLARRDDAPERIPPRLLPAYDPYVLGWRDRSFAVADRHAARVQPGGGVLRATATVDGRAVATWTARRRGGRLAIELDGFGRIPRADAEALRADADDVARFEGLEPG